MNAQHKQTEAEWMRWDCGHSVGFYINIETGVSVSRCARSAWMWGRMSLWTRWVRTSCSKSSPPSLETCTQTPPPYRWTFTYNLCGHTLIQTKKTILHCWCHQSRWFFIVCPAVNWTVETHRDGHAHTGWTHLTDRTWRLSRLASFIVVCVYCTGSSCAICSIGWTVNWLIKVSI